MFNIYSNGAFYKQLPIGGITSTLSGEKKITIGFQPTDLIQII